MKKILFIGNSFTYFNDLPAMTETLLKNAGISCRAASVTKGGAYLHEYADREHELNRRFEEAYGNENYDFVVLQDQSFNPAGDKADFMAAVHTLSTAVRAGGKNPCLLFYQTWAYRYGSEKLSGTGIDYETMRLRLKAAYEEAAARFDGRCVPPHHVRFIPTLCCITTMHTIRRPPGPILPRCFLQTPSPVSI